ncbi:MAG TPA: 50S ribosomal protein L5 [Firmicutes bacterium]|nr:50S ribosomal protein L5 [Bacillota bacterium]
MSRFKEKYQREAVPSLKKKFGYKNVMQIPQIKKVVINMGVGDATTDAKAIDAAVGDMTAISGQKPVVTKAKKSIAAFKVRAGAPIGCMVTLRGQRMHDFLDKLFNISLPRIRDFKGVSPKAFDGRGNYTLGIHDQLIFPEINYDKVEKVRGMDIVIVTSAVNDEEAFELLKVMGMPFRA